MKSTEKIKAEINRLQETTMDENSNFKSQYDQGIFDGLSLIDNFIDSLEEEPVSNDLEEASVNYAATGLFLPNGKEMIDFQVEKAFKAGAQWQKQQDQSTIELAEDHAYLAGQEKIIDMACEFLRSHIDKQLVIYHEFTWRSRDEFIEGFKKAMKE